MKKCPTCKEDKEVNSYHKNKNLKDGLDRVCKECKSQQYKDKRDANPLHTYHIAKRSWCKQRGIPYELTLQDLKDKWTGICPVLGIKVQLGASGKGSHQSAHLDRFNPDEGYTVENTAWLSGRANRIKYDATLSELKAIVCYMESKQHG